MSNKMKELNNKLNIGKDKIQEDFYGDLFSFAIFIILLAISLTLIFNILVGAGYLALGFYILFLKNKEFKKDIIKHNI